MSSSQGHSSLGLLEPRTPDSVFSAVQMSPFTRQLMENTKVRAPCKGLYKLGSASQCVGSVLPLNWRARYRWKSGTTQLKPGAAVPAWPETAETSPAGMMWVALSRDTAGGEILALGDQIASRAGTDLWPRSCWLVAPTSSGAQLGLIPGPVLPLLSWPESFLAL